MFEFEQNYRHTGTSVACVNGDGTQTEDGRICRLWWSWQVSVMRSVVIRNYICYKERILQNTDMIFLCFKAEFRYPECPILLKFVSVFDPYFTMQRMVPTTKASWEQHLTKKLHRDNVKIESAKYSLFGISIKKMLGSVVKVPMKQNGSSDRGNSYRRVR